MDIRSENDFCITGLWEGNYWSRTLCVTVMLCYIKSLCLTTTFVPIITLMEQFQQQHLLSSLCSHQHSKHRTNDIHFTNEIFKFIILDGNCCILIQIFNPWIAFQVSFSTFYFHLPKARPLLFLTEICSQGSINNSSYGLWLSDSHHLSQAWPNLSLHICVTRPTSVGLISFCTTYIIREM